jgi:hypothetical protein
MLDFSLRRALSILGVTVVATISGCDRPSATHETVSKGFPAASNGLLDLDGRKFDLWQSGDDAAATVLVFSRSDCPISNRYAPTVKKLYGALQPRGVRFYLVYVDPKEGPDEIRRHLTDYNYPCPGLRDPNHTLVDATGVTVTPEAVVYNAKHDVVYRGRIDNLYAAFGQSRDVATTHELADAIDAALAGQPVAEPSTTAVGCPIADLR